MGVEVRLGEGCVFLSPRSLSFGRRWREGRGVQKRRKNKSQTAGIDQKKVKKYVSIIQPSQKKVTTLRDNEE